VLDDVLEGMLEVPGILLTLQDIGIDDQIPRSRELHSKRVHCTFWVLLVKHVQDSDKRNIAKFGVIKSHMVVVLWSRR
jgi:hypothetical protein